MDDDLFKPYYNSERAYLPYRDDPRDDADIQAAVVPQDPLEVSIEKRVGIHYFTDTKHYSRADLERWLPIMQNLGVNWAVLPAPTDRAVPQEFIDALIAADINPIIHFNCSLSEPPSTDELRTLMTAYANWGVRFVVFFDRPNLRSQWPVNGWTQRGLVTRFLDIFQPLAEAAIETGLTPVFPPLEPGGDFWDTAFLRAALEALAENGEGTLRESLVLGAYAWTEDKSMTWGAGGPENWPATMPYHTPENSEDQRGFRIFDWYNATSRAVLGKELPIILIGAGVQRESSKPLDARQGTRAVNITETLQRNPDPDKNNTVPANVISCNFWLLSAIPETPEAALAWYKVNGKPSKFADEYMAWKLGVPESKALPKDNQTFVVSRQPHISHTIQHYLLLPNTTEWPMDVIRSFINETKATMGISEQEAAKASRVTLAGGLETYSDELLRTLIKAGCQVDLLPMESAA